MAQAQVLPKELRLTAPPTMPQARSYLFKQASVEQTVPFGNTVTINLPRLQRSYLTKDSYLRFDLHLEYNPALAGNTTHAGVPCWDTPGAFGWIDKIEVFDYLGSTLLESTSGHGQLMALLMDLGVSKSSLANHYNAIAGTTGGTGTRWRNAVYEPNKYKTTTDAASAAALVDLVPTKNTVGVTDDTQPAFMYDYDNARVNTHDAPNSGEVLATKYDNEPAIDAGHPETYDFNATVAVHRQYAIPLFSFLGLLSTKYAPLHNGYTIVITTNPLYTALGAVTHNLAATPVATATEVKASNTALLPAVAISRAFVDNVNFCCQILELGPIAEGMLLDSTAGAPLIVPTKAYRNYIGQVNEDQTSYRLDLNLNVASLTNILWTMRPSEAIADIRMRSLSNRVRNFLQNWYFQYGSSVLPQTSGINAQSPIGQPAGGAGFTEAYAELLKARHGWNKEEHATLINSENFTIDEAVWFNDLWGIINQPSSSNASNSIYAGSRQPMNDSRGPYSPYLSIFNTSPVGKFACGLDLELVSGKSNEVICGMNTNGMNTSIIANFDPRKVGDGHFETPHIRSCRVDAWAEYDAFINISPSIATTVSF